MRPPFSRLAGLALLVLVGLTPPAISNAEEPRTGQVAAEPGATQAAAKTSSEQLEALRADIDAASIETYKILIRGRKLQYDRPRAAADEDAAAHAQRQRNLGAWVTQVEALRIEMQDYEAKVGTLKGRIREIRRLELSDADIDLLVLLEPGVQNIIRGLQRSERELDVAWRQGTNAMDDPPGR